MNDAEGFRALEDLYQQSIGVDLESFDSCCTRYLHQLLRKANSSVREPINVIKSSWEPAQTTRKLMIEKYS